jgi:hypothetical protein
LTFISFCTFWPCVQSPDNETPITWLFASPDQTRRRLTLEQLVIGRLIPALNMATLRRALTLLLACLLTIVSAGSFDSPFVKALTATNFKKQVLGTDVRDRLCISMGQC